jgi:hypothetical protein
MFKVGDSVEALFGNGNKYFPGVITADHGDGKFDIQYADGDKEKNKSAALLCSLVAPGKFNAGQKIEARFGGNHKWFPGTIEGDNGDGSYSVRYDDGDQEPSVRFIRELATESHLNPNRTRSELSAPTTEPIQVKRDVESKPQVTMESCSREQLQVEVATLRQDLKIQKELTSSWMMK